MLFNAIVKIARHTQKKRWRNISPVSPNPGAMISRGLPYQVFQGALLESQRAFNTSLSRSESIGCQKS